MDKMEIRYVNHSIANRFNDRIEVNRHLKNYPHLLEPLLAHEMKHTDKAWSLQDFKLDFLSNSKINPWEMFKFVIKHPSSWLQPSPIIYSKGEGFIIDYSLTTLYLIMLLTFISTIYFGVKYL